MANQISSYFGVSICPTKMTSLSNYFQMLLTLACEYPTDSPLPLPSSDGKQENDF